MQTRVDANPQATVLGFKNSSKRRMRNQRRLINFEAEVYSMRNEEMNLAIFVRPEPFDGFWFGTSTSYGVDCSL
jgi:hypothetical protein